jgi:DNA-binding FadR family transcriptional regulator
MFGGMISRRPGASLYEQVADAIRQKINSGELAPGDRLQSEKYLAEEYEVGRDTIRDALQHLRKEGLIESRRGYRTTVRKRIERQAIRLEPGEHVYARMPTPDECHELTIVTEGVPVLVVGDKVYPADRYQLFAE